MIRRLSFAAAALLAAAPLYAVTYTFEPEHTQGVVRWNHLGFANPTAQFNNVQGTLEFDQADPGRSSVMVTIPLTSMSTGVPGLNEDFQSSDFFDFAKFPAATFKSSKVEKGATPGTLKVVGDLNLHGITKPVALDVTINKVGTNPRNQVPTVGFEAMATLKRSDFGLGLYVPQVSDEVHLHITAEAAEKGAYEQYRKAQAAREAQAARQAAEKAKQ
ncbi:MAG TPA: YceI family protein [Steroidobacteraceae bacterium]|jgi:polyisoprenoid-binding protein YceI|nr:YceI family protein [Steroidobacteraceae bacterium]